MLVRMPGTVAFIIRKVSKKSKIFSGVVLISIESVRVIFSNNAMVVPPCININSSATMNS